MLCMIPCKSSKTSLPYANLPHLNCFISKLPYFKNAVFPLLRLWSPLSGGVSHHSALAMPFLHFQYTLSLIPFVVFCLMMIQLIYMDNITSLGHDLLTQQVGYPQMVQTFSTG